MSTPPRRCPGCGFESPRPEARFCERCGLALETAPAEAAPPADLLGDVPARLRALAGHPDLAGLLAATPEVPELAGRTLPSLLLLLGLTVLGGLAALLCFQICPPLGFVPLVLVIVGAGAVLRQVLWNARTPLVARPALVVELRARVQAGAEHSHDHRRHLAVLQLASGERVERECYPSVVGSVVPGAAGVAYEKGERLAGFARLPV